MIRTSIRFSGSWTCSDHWNSKAHPTESGVQTGSEPVPRLEQNVAQRGFDVGVLKCESRVQQKFRLGALAGKQQSVSHLAQRYSQRESRHRQKRGLIQNARNRTNELVVANRIRRTCVR